jgi:predicted ArsR family transcriptional regulator
MKTELSYKEDGTSKDAAEAMATRAPVLHDKVLAALRLAPKTADEIALFIGESVLAVRPRVSELNRSKVIEKNGERRPNASGRSAYVWRMRAAAPAIS